MYSSVIITARMRGPRRSLLVAFLLLPITFQFCGFVLHCLCLILAHRNQSACIQYQRESINNLIAYQLRVIEVAKVLGLPVSRQRK